MVSTQKDIENLADKILAKIRGRKGYYYSLSGLESYLKTDSHTILKAADILHDWGYRIDSKKNKLAFLGAPDKFLPDEITLGLKTKYIGREVLAYQSVQSTNTLAHVLAASGAKEGTLIISEHQKQGRGRHNKKWFSTDSVGLYCSIILKPNIHPSHAPGLSLVTALALADTIKKYGKIDVSIKWPNDVLINGKKVAGILTEMSSEFDRTHFVIVGIGVNTNHQRNQFPQDIKKSAISIRQVLGKSLIRVKFLQNFLYHFEKEYDIFKKDGLTQSINRIIQLSSLINREISLKIGRKKLSGKVLNIDNDGCLVVRTKNGVKTYHAGEVSINHKY
jgi:BirA family biotin operon repressor/biotin-[acetyl-CoA-carboxylase] ligase